MSKTDFKEPSSRIENLFVDSVFRLHQKSICFEELEKKYYNPALQVC